MRHACMAAAVALLAALGAAAIAGAFLSRAAKRAIDPPPPELAATSIRIPVDASAYVAGWFARGEPGAGAVLLLHGVRSDRTQMLGRARALRSAGYSVLLLDLPAHGESSGERISFGMHEAVGVRAALAFLRQQLPAERIGVIGVSLGAAALVLSHASPAPHAVVLESMYPTFAEAVGNRLAMHFGTLARMLTPLLSWQLPLRLGLPAAQLQPIEQLDTLRSPVLIASGTDDLHTTWPETQRLFAAAAEPKELWLVTGAAHVDLHAFAPAAYEARVFGFLSRHLRGAP